MRPPAPEAGVPEGAAPSTPGDSSSQSGLRIFPANREVALTAPVAKDVVEAQVVGADCAQARLSLTLLKRGGLLPVPLRARNGYVGVRSSIQAEMGTSYCAVYDPEFPDRANTYSSSSS